MSDDGHEECRLTVSELIQQREAVSEENLRLLRQLDEARGDAARMRAALEHILNHAQTRTAARNTARVALTETPAAPAPGAVLDTCPKVDVFHPYDPPTFCSQLCREHGRHVASSGECAHPPSAPQAPAIGLADVIRGALCRVLGIGRDEEIALATKTIVADIEYRKPATGLDPATVEACAKAARRHARHVALNVPEDNCVCLTCEAALEIEADIRALASSREGVK